LKSVYLAYWGLCAQNTWKWFWVWKTS